MAKSYVQFKQFRVEQQHSAMKVCTDACVFGAWLDAPNCQRALDIGTGTGLLALLFAQRSNAQIDAVEIDELAFQEAQKNVQNSPFTSKITLFNQKIQDFEPDCRYDFIFTNPPFYQNSLLSPQQKTNQAHHAESLTFDELIESIVRLLQPKGIFSILLPIYESAVFEKSILEKKLFLSKRLNLQHQADKPVFRVLSTYKYEEKRIEESTLSVFETDTKTYTQAFETLLKDYYVIF